jgi:hypothetical protein
MSFEIRIPARYNGPPQSGNGGYSCGTLAAFIEGPARARLHLPPPLDTALTVTIDTDGSVEMRDGETLVGSGGPCDYHLDVPAPPSLQAAERAMAGFPCYEDHAFPTCFVCGPGRPQHDGLDIFPGPVEGSDLLACPWTPAPDLLDDAGLVRAVILWSALDCPGYFAAMRGNLRAAVLGELEGEIIDRPRGGETLVVYSWPLGQDGRKSWGGAAIATAAGEVVASARSTWIELRDPV